MQYRTMRSETCHVGPRPSKSPANSQGREWSKRLQRLLLEASGDLHGLLSRGLLSQGPKLIIGMYQLKAPRTF